MWCLVHSSTLHFNLNYDFLRMQFFVCVSVKQVSIALISTGNRREFCLSLRQTGTLAGIRGDKLT